VSWSQLVGYLGVTALLVVGAFGVYTYLTRNKPSKGWRDSHEGE